MKNDIIPKLSITEWFIFLYSFAILFNLAFLCLVYFPIQESPDAASYLGLAQLDFDQNPVRRYRIIIPFLAGAINFLFGRLFDWVHPWNFEGDFSLCFSFLMVNVSILSIAYTFVFRMIRNLGVVFWPAIIGITAAISSRWSAEITGVPLVDSLYFLSLVIILYGIIGKKHAFLLVGIWLGPWAKESFILFLPFILWFSEKQWKNVLIHYFISYGVYFCFRIGYDSLTGYSSHQAIQEDLSHFQNIVISLQRLFSLHGVYEVFSVVGIWILIPVYLLIKKRIRFTFHSKIQIILFVYLFIVLLHSLLSSDIGRMCYLSAPVLAIIIAYSVQELLMRKEIIQIPE